MCADMHADTRADMRAGMRADMRVYRHVYRHACRQAGVQLVYTAGLQLFAWHRCRYDILVITNMLYLICYN